MGVIETIIYSIIIGFICFGIGFLVAYLTFKKYTKTPKQYGYSDINTFDIKESVNTDVLGSNHGSDIDGANALEKFLK